MAIKRTTTMPKSKRNWLSIMVKVAYGSAVAAAVLVAVQFWRLGAHYNKLDNVDAMAAVTLTNGQTYFGYLQKFGPGVTVLSGVYYLQTDDQSEGTATTDPTAETDTASDSSVKLVHLTDDFHKPQDALIVNTNQVLFWQYLSDESPILDAIDELNK